MTDYDRHLGGRYSCHAEPGEPGRRIVVRSTRDGHPVTAVPATDHGPVRLVGTAPWPVLLARVGAFSAREHDVFLLLGAGASNRTIAGCLRVTERTVKAHVARVMAKLVVESRLQAGLVSLMFQLGGAEPPAFPESVH